MILLPISTDNPVGSDVSLNENYLQTKEYRYALINKNDGSWNVLKHLCIDILSKYSKDLRVLTFLFEARLMADHDAGLVEAFEETYHFIKDYLDICYPLEMDYKYDSIILLDKIISDKILYQINSDFDKDKVHHCRQIAIALNDLLLSSIGAGINMIIDALNKISTNNQTIINDSQEVQYRDEKTKNLQEVINESNIALMNIATFLESQNKNNPSGMLIKLAVNIGRMSFKELCECDDNNNSVLHGISLLYNVYENLYGAKKLNKYVINKVFNDFKK